MRRGRLASLSRAGKSRFLPIAALGLALALAGTACGSPQESAGERSRLGAELGWLVVPAGETSNYRFEEHALSEHLQSGESRTLPFAPAPPGKPLASACDVQGGSAAVAYTHALAALDLVEGRIKWLPVEWPVQPRILSVSGTLAATLAGDDLSVWRVRDAKLLWRESTAAWLHARGLTRIDYALPLSPDEFLLVASKPVGFASASRLLAYRVSRAGGDWRSSNDHLVPELSNLHRCTSDGRDVYLAGVQEETRPGRGAGPELIQTLVVVRLSAGDFSRAVLVREELHRLETEVEDLTAGPGWVGVVLKDGQTGEFALRIHRTTEDARTARLVYERTGSGPTLAAWMGPSLAVVWNAEGSSFVAVP
jgi:hypothetical protein